MTAQRVLGIDPGLAATGYGVIDGDRNSAAPVTWGVIRSTARIPREQRLLRIYHGVLELIDEYAPAELAVEQQYVRDNVRSAMAIGEARSAAIIAAAERGIPVSEYSPSAIKLAVTGYGGAPKEQVQSMLMLQLGLSEPPTPLDASDALGIALTRLAEGPLEALHAEQGRGAAR